MTKSFRIVRRNGLLLTLFVIGALVLTIVFLPQTSRTEAVAGRTASTEFEVTSSHKPELANYDIRNDKSADAQSALASFRQQSGRSSANTAEVRQEFLNAEANLRSDVPTLKIEYSSDLRAPEVIGTRVESGTFLTARSSEKRVNQLRNFILANNRLIGLTDQQVRQLTVAADYTNPDGNLSYVHLEQEIKGLPVFRGEIKAGFTKDGSIIRIINNLAPALEYSSLSTESRRAEDAVTAAALNINRTVSSNDLKVQETNPNGKVITFVPGQFAWPTTAEKMYFPTEPGVARLAWRVLLWEEVAAYYVIVDAETGTMLWRKNITEDQTQTATYNIYNDDSPAPFVPGPTTLSGAQAPLINRTDVTLIGNEPPNTFNNLGWLTDGANVTDGNNVEAGLDRVAPNGVDAPVTGVARVFSFAYNPGPGNPAPGDAPLTLAYQNGAVTNLFYWTNRYHDSMYLLGFTEAARNFQNVNFTGMGLGADRVSAEAQDSSGTNNANFGTPADGGRGRMQMYIWTAPNPDRDGDLDQDIVYHELTHGLSNRLHGNASGLGSNMSRGMGEGWGDFYAHCLLSTPADPLAGIYNVGAYSLGSPGFLTNYYYGIRRFPKAILSFTGGAGNLPHNPLTFADVDSTQANLTDGAFPPAFSGTADQVHNAGEVWNSALWEVRARIITRIGAAPGNTRVLQLVTDGMKLAPLNPTFLQERDAIVAAAQAMGGSDTSDVWAGFALRGMGFSAQVLFDGTAGSTRVFEAFDPPNLRQAPTFTVSDSSGNNNGYLEPTESVLVTVPVTNPTGNTVTGVTVSVNGGPAVSYGTIANNATVSMAIPVTLPAVPCGTTTTLAININSSLGATGSSGVLGPLGIPTFAGSTQDFDGVVAPALPNLWTQTNTGTQTPWVTTTTGPDTAPNSAFSNDGASSGESFLTTPLVQVTSASASMSFRLNYSFEAPDWDAMVLEISIAGGAFQDIVAAGGSFVTGGYTGFVNTTAGNPLAGQFAWIGTSGGYITSTVNLPASANGQVVRLRWRIGTDAAASGVGANVDTVSLTGSQFSNGFTCPPIVSACNNDPRADFDGDGRSDFSVFRGGNWFVQRSTAGFFASGFGLPGDTIVPGDYDGDNKADLAVMRTVGGSLVWYIFGSTSGYSVVGWGAAGDIDVAADYDGDNKTDVAVYRPGSPGVFFVRSSAAGGGLIAQAWGTAGDIPLTADFDGDCKSDYGVFRAGTWHLLRSTAGYGAIPFGAAGDRIAHADYDGDNKADVAVARNVGGGLVWYVLGSTAGFSGTSWGVNTDIVTPGDFDGDGKDDIAVFRGSSGTWFVLRSSTGSLLASPFGTAGDVPVPSGYLP